MATCFREVLLCPVLEKNVTAWHEILRKHSDLRFSIEKLRKHLLNCLIPFFQIFVALLKRCSRKKFVSNTSVHIIQLFQLAVLYFTRLIKWTNSVFKYSWTSQHKTTATLETNKVAVVKRFKKESIYGMSAKKAAVVERWSLLDVRLDSVLSIS